MPQQGDAASVGNRETTPHAQAPEGPAGQSLTTTDHKRLCEAHETAAARPSPLAKQAGWKASATVGQTVFSVEDTRKAGGKSASL